MHHNSSMSPLVFVVAGLGHIPHLAFCTLHVICIDTRPIPSQSGYWAPRHNPTATQHRTPIQSYLLTPSHIKGKKVKSYLILYSALYRVPPKCRPSKMSGTTPPGGQIQHQTIHYIFPLIHCIAFLSSCTCTYTFQWIYMLVGSIIMQFFFSQSLQLNMKTLI